jgi:hypothetical protein
MALKNDSFLDSTGERYPSNGNPLGPDFTKENWFKTPRVTKYTWRFCTQEIDFYLVGNEVAAWTI